MRTLPHPTLVSGDIFDEIATAKRRATRHTLEGIRERVLARFDEYGIESLRSIAAVAWSEAERAALLLCYESAVPPRKELRKSILQAAGQYCPYCGIDRPTTVDHYVPKDEHPEFSVFPPNLVGCCAPCNNIKRAAWIEQGIRLFLHAYFDHLPPESACLTARISWANGKPSFTFELTPHADVPAELYQTVVSHVRRLKLIHWYNGRAAEEFDSFDPVGEQVSTEVLRELVQRRKVTQNRADWGPLSWKAALWAAVLNDPAAVAHLQARLAKR